MPRYFKYDESNNDNRQSSYVVDGERVGYAFVDCRTDEEIARAEKDGYTRAMPVKVKKAATKAVKAVKIKASEVEGEQEDNVG